MNWWSNWCSIRAKASDAMDALLGIEKPEARLYREFGTHLQQMERALHRERLVMHAGRWRKHLLSAARSADQPSIDWNGVISEFLHEHPQLAQRHTLLVARLKEQARRDLIPPKWGHVLLALMDQINQERQERNQCAAEATSKTQMTCPPAPVSGWGNPLLAKLYKKSMDIETGEAMWMDRHQWVRKMAQWWHSLSSDTKTSILGLCLVIPMLSPLVDIFGASSATVITFSLAMISVGVLGAIFWAAINSLSAHLMIDHHDKERLSSQLLATLQHHPQSQELVEFLNSHLDHPDIYGYWWRQVEVILEETAKAPRDEVVIVEEHSSRQQLKKALNDLVVIDPDHQDGENEGRAASQLRTKL